MTSAFGWKRAYAVILLCVATAIASGAQTFTTLVNFNGTDGARPYLMSLIQGTDGKFYGTTLIGGTNNSGTVFKVTPGGTLTTLYNFCNQPNCSDGREPFAGLVQATDGNFYGTTEEGGDVACDGPNGCGTIFRITPSGALTRLHTFNGTDGANPYAVLVQARDGNLYGTTRVGGTGFGTMFKITLGGKLTTLHNFSIWIDGAYPQAGLLEATNGNLYGTTGGGGSDRCIGGCGTVFKMTPWGKLTTLYMFCTQVECTDGFGPTAVSQASDGNFYGTTYGGDSSLGTVFKLTSGGTLTTLHTFGGTDGENPLAGLVQAIDGNFYGTTVGGGANSVGTVFTITSRGGLTTLHNFNSDDGAGPTGGLVPATNGTFYGTTVDGGDGGYGTVFGVDMGLGPFVGIARNPAKVGQAFGILGEGFAGTANVSLNGTPVSFQVISDTFLKATVPAGATTGPVTVTTPSGTLTSNKPFRVTPQLLSFDPPSGLAGTQVSITGVSLTQTQGVGFGNRVPAQFTVNSDSQVTATVPSGAKTGKVGIQTQGGTAISSGTFTVTP